MTQSRRDFGVVQWSSETDESLAAPGERSRLLEHGVGGRVVLLIGNDGPFKIVRLGDCEFRLSPEKIISVNNAIYAVGDTVVHRGRPAKIVDAIWHYAKGEPIYFLEIDGKRSSKRYFGDDLNE